MAKKKAGIDSPNVNNNGGGIWGSGTSTNGSVYPGSGNPLIGKNALGLDTDNAVIVKDFNGGSACCGSMSSGASPDQGTGAPNRPSPDQSLVGKANTDSPDQGSGSANKPSPNQGLVSSKSAFVAPARPSSFGGVEKGVQIQ